MEALTGRIETAARHLGLIDRLCNEVNAEYAAMRTKLLQVPGLEDISGQLYGGQSGRQMVLGDLLLYILSGRGSWAATISEEGFRNFVRIILYAVNLLLIQESIFSARIDERRRILRSLEQENLPNFFASDEERNLYRQLREFDGFVEVGHPLYRTMDSLLPKSLGASIELIVYVHLLHRRIGYVVPLLFVQRLFNGMENIAPPDYLLLREDGNVFGIEVGPGTGRFGPAKAKVQQVNVFAQETALPVLTAEVPHLYRCETCHEWITFCDHVIERAAQGEIQIERISAMDCPLSAEHMCERSVYFGETKSEGSKRRHHYQHYLRNQYVQRTALVTERSRRSRLLHYFPHVSGLERMRAVV